METPNPYESPHGIDEMRKDEHFVRRYFPLLAGGLAGGLLLSAFAPFVGVPLTLVATPAMVRATRIYWRTVRGSGQPDWTDWCGLFFASLAVVLPVSFVGGIAFCCVCTAGGFVTYNVENYRNDAALSMSLMYTVMYLGLAAGLLASLFLLKRFNYLSKIEKDALQQDTVPDSTQSETD
ncbi:MAG: hypothetical protein O3C40_01170 [Planctomycetota bacterium]|nr:hypothetical protein [Planctomycetota bacterium]